jgi:hypothetical protein
MKRIITILSLFSGVLAGCTVQNQSPISLENAIPYTMGDPDECEPDGDIALTQGSLDVSGSTNFRMTFRYVNELQPVSTVVDGTTVGTEQNDVTARQLQIHYESVPALPLEDVVEPVWFVFPAGGGGDDAWIGLNLISSQAAQVIQTAVVPGVTYNLEVSFKLVGVTAAGKQIDSNTVVYPIRLFSSGFTGCPSGQVQAGTGPCGSFGGQNGSFVGCIVPE